MAPDALSFRDRPLRRRLGGAAERSRGLRSRDRLNQHSWSNVIDLTAGHFAEPGATGSLLFEPIYGAAARVPPDDTAFAGREARYNVTFSSSWTDPADDDRQIAQARSYSAALGPWAHGGGYIN